MIMHRVCRFHTATGLYPAPEKGQEGSVAGGFE